MNFIHLISQSQWDWDTHFTQFFLTEPSRDQIPVSTPKALLAFQWLHISLISVTENI